MAILGGFHGEVVREPIDVEGRVFLIDRPVQPEITAASGDVPLPYWAALWPGARMLAKAVLMEKWTPGTPALEIGCGLGLPGIAALSVGLQVTFSDFAPPALPFAAANARLNGFDDFKTLQLDWRNPPPQLRAQVLLASDLVYEVSNVEPLVNFVKVVLAPDGLFLLAEQDRLPSRALREALEDSGLAFTTTTARTAETGQKRVKGTVYRIQRDM